MSQSPYVPGHRCISSTRLYPLDFSVKVLCHLLRMSFWVQEMRDEFHIYSAKFTSSVTTNDQFYFRLDSIDLEMWSTTKKETWMDTLWTFNAADELNSMKYQDAEIRFFLWWNSIRMNSTLWFQHTKMKQQNINDHKIILIVSAMRRYILNQNTYVILELVHSFILWSNKACGCEIFNKTKMNWNTEK